MAYDPIANGELVAGQPVKQSLMFRLRDNPLAIAAGDPGAPRVAIDVAGQTAIATDELDPTKRLAPDGAGGVTWQGAASLVDDFVAGFDKVFAGGIQGGVSQMTMANASVAGSLGAVRLTYSGGNGASAKATTDVVRDLNTRAWDISTRVRRNTAWNNDSGAIGIGALSGVAFQPSGVYIRSRPGALGGRWNFSGWGAGGEDSGIAVSADWQVLRVRRVDATPTSDYEFYIDGVLLYVLDGNTAGIPDMTTGFFLGFVGAQNGAAGNMQLDFDWLRVIFL